MASKPLIGLAIERASAAVAAGDSAEAWEWLSSISPADRPVALAASCLDMLSRSAADSGDWSEALRAAVDANHVAPMSARQARAALLRRRAALLADGAWTTIREAVEPAHLDPAAMRPEIQLVYACGAYHSRGRGSVAPWSRYLRMSKTPEGTREERRAVLKLAAQYLARFVAELTPLLKHVEIVVPVPANPDRYVRRMASLPDELARTTGESLALEVLRDALRWRGDLADVEMKRLSSAERRQVSAQVFMAGNQVPHVAGRSVLLVDDVTTYGSTLRACARRLLDSGATAVYACCLAHTEG